MNDWNPLNKANQMTETIWDGVYLINIDVPAFNEEEEWFNKFKICKIDDITCKNGWLGSTINYKFSWIGYEAEAGYTTVSEFATSVITWLADKIHVDKIPDIKESYDDLLGKLLYDYDLETDTANDKVTYHFYNAKGWDNVGAWVQGA